MNVQEFFNFQGNWSSSIQYKKVIIPSAIQVGIPFVSVPLVKDQDNILALTGNTVPTLGTRPAAELNSSWTIVSYGVHIAISAPTAGSDKSLGFLVGQLWVNTTNGDCYLCTSNTVGAAVWKSFAGNV